LWLIAEKDPELTIDDWVTFTSGSSGRGAGRLSFNILEHGKLALRATTIRAGNELLVVQQNGVIPGTTATPDPAIVYTTDAVSTVTVAVRAAPGVSWTASRLGSTFLQLIDGSSGSGPGTLKLTIQAHTELRAGSCESVARC
jgi:hypothetical protein